MTPKIKSIKLKESTKDLLNNQPPEGFTNTFQDVLDKFPEYFEIEYEKPTLLKRPDGSLISEPENGVKVWIIKTGFLTEDKDEGYFPSLENYYSLEHNICLKQGYIYEQQEEHLAEKKAEMLTKQLEIQYEIDRLNAEEGWKSEHPSSCTTRYTLEYIHYSNSVRIESYGAIKPSQFKTVFMSEKTAETILAKYSQNELKKYLGIII